MKNSLLDSDGENKAVRAFLAAYRHNNELTIATMKTAMWYVGFESLIPPELTLLHENTHLTKWAAQLWLRYLFDMEKQYESSSNNQQNL